MLKKIGLSLFALVSTVLIANAISGNQLGFPIVGGASYCASYGNGGVCNSTIAAGPTITTGNETILGNTNLSNGQSPQTVLFPVSILGAGPYQYSAPSTGATLTLTAQQRRLIVAPTTTLATLAVVFPAASALSDNQLMGLCSTQIVTALTLTAGSGTTILNGPTALAVPPATGAGTCYEWVYRQTNTSWYRVQ